MGRMASRCGHYLQFTSAIADAAFQYRAVFLFPDLYHPNSKASLAPTQPGLGDAQAQVRSNKTEFPTLPTGRKMSMRTRQ